MLDYIESLLVRYRTKGILIDTNLLLLYFVGSYDPQRIEKYKRTKNRKYSLEDFQRLKRLINHFEMIVTTPNILTEVSNLTSQLPDAYFQVFCERLTGFEETYISSRDVCKLPHFSHFRLTDSGIIDLAPTKHLVLTDDLELYGYLVGNGVDAVNFNHIRTLNWR